MEASGSTSQAGQDTLDTATIQQVIAAGTDVKDIDDDALRTLGSAAEGFLSALVQTSARSMAPGQQELQYKNVADAVEATACLDFLEDIVPQQVTVATYLKSAQQQQAQQQQAKT